MNFQEDLLWGYMMELSCTFAARNAEETIISREIIRKLIG